MLATNTVAAEETIPSPITVLDTAAAKIYELMLEENNLSLSLRIYVTGGGCSGLQYNFAFEEAINDSDTVVEKLAIFGEQEHPVKILLDPISMQYLLGAEVDYKDDIEGGHFVIRNPNAKTSCGCGSSFAV